MLFCLYVFCLKPYGDLYAVLSVCALLKAVLYIYIYIYYCVSMETVESRKDGKVIAMLFCLYIYALLKAVRSSLCYFVD